MAVVLPDLLNEKQVTLELSAKTRDETLREIVATLPIDPAKLIAEVAAREKTQSTYVGNGIAFPHARTDLVTQIVLGIGRSSAGVPFGENAELAHLIFLVAVPRRMVTDYLVCVGALARLTKDPETRTALMNAAAAEELAGILREGSLLLK